MKIGKIRVNYNPADKSFAGRQNKGDHAIPGHWVLRFPNSKLLNFEIVDKVTGTWPQMQTSFRETSKNRAKFSIKNLFSRIFIRIIALTYVFFKYDFIFHDRQVTLKVRKIYKYNVLFLKIRLGGN